MTWEDYGEVHDRVNSYLEQHGLGLCSHSPRRRSNKIKCYIGVGDWITDKRLTENIEFVLSDDIEKELMKWADQTLEIWNSPLSVAMREEK